MLSESSSAPRGAKLTLADRKKLTMCKAIMKSLHYDIEIKGARAIVVLKQEYINDYDKELDAEYVCPVLVNCCLLGFKATCGNKVYSGVVGEKEDVKKRKEELAAKNVTTATVIHHKEYQDLIKIEIASIPPKGKLELELTYSIPLSLENSRTKKLTIPITILPRYESNDDQVSAPSTSDDSSKNSLAKIDKTIVFKQDSGYKMTFELRIAKAFKFELSNIKMEDVECFTSLESQELSVKLKKDKFYIPNFDFICKVEYENPLDCIKSIDPTQEKCKLEGKIYACPSTMSNSDKLPYCGKVYLNFSDRGKVLLT